MATVKSNIAAAIAAIQNGDDPYAIYYLGIILGAPSGLVIKLETTTEYSQYKIGIVDDLYINTNHALNTLDEATFGTAVNAIFGDAPASAKAMSRDAVRIGSRVTPKVVGVTPGHARVTGTEKS